MPVGQAERVPVSLFPSQPLPKAMSAPSRTAQFNKLHKILKKHYKPVAPDSERTVLEQTLFASCAENAHYAAAEEAYAALVHNFSKITAH